MGINEWMASWKKRGWKTAAKEQVKNARPVGNCSMKQCNRHDITWKLGYAGTSVIPVIERADHWANLAEDEVRGYKQS